MSEELQKPEPSAPPAPQGEGRVPPQHRHHKTSEELIHEAEQEGFMRQHRGLVIAAAIVVIGLGVYFFPKPGPSQPYRPPEQMVMIKPIAPPPPKVRPPPPPPQKPPPEKMEKAAPQEEEVKPKEAPPPQSALATGLKGDGAGIGLASSGTGIGSNDVIGSNGGKGRNWGAYNSQVQSKIAAALSTNARTKHAVFGRLEVRIWPDVTGRIVQVKLGQSTGDRALDEAIQNQVLNGLQLSGPPPAGMPLPIVLALSAKR